LNVVHIGGGHRDHQFVRYRQLLFTTERPSIARAVEHMLTKLGYRVVRDHSDIDGTPLSIPKKPDPEL
jgi:hypothetical protein